jgi:hypothetical protein
MTTKS